MTKNVNSILFNFFGLFNLDYRHGIWGLWVSYVCEYIVNQVFNVIISVWYPESILFSPIDYILKYNYFHI